MTRILTYPDKYLKAGLYCRDYEPEPVRKLISYEPDSVHCPTTHNAHCQFPK